MCKYCEEMKSLYWNKNHHTVNEIYIENDGSLTINIPSFESEIDESINIKINYCPICGRRLEVVENENI